MTPQAAKISDLQLLQLLNEEKATALELIYSQYWNKLCSYAYRLYDSWEVCEDLVQEVFISFWERPDYTDIKNLRAYLFTAVKYQVFNHQQRRSVERLDEDLLLNLPSEEASQEKKIEYQEFQEDLLMQIKQLPPKCRKVFLLSRLKKLTNAEIAAVLNISIRTVESHISTALRILRSQAVGIAG